MSVLRAQPITFEHSYSGINTKTPARSRNRKENAIGGHTVHGKSTGLNAPKTPGAPGMLRPQRISKDDKPTYILNTVSKPLNDRTPFPSRQITNKNMQTPLLKKTAAVQARATPYHIPEPEMTDQSPHLPPSSTRKSARNRRSSAGGNQFQTPISTGNHWDISADDIVVDAQPEAAPSAKPIVKEDYEEVEYTPPAIPEAPYYPAFDMPDYKVLLGTLRKQTYSGYPFGGPDDLPWYADSTAELPIFESVDWNDIDLASLNHYEKLFPNLQLNADNSTTASLERATNRTAAKSIQSINKQPRSSRNLVQSSTSSACARTPTAPARSTRPVSALSKPLAASTKQVPPVAGATGIHTSRPTSTLPSRTSSNVRTNAGVITTGLRSRPGTAMSTSARSAPTTATAISLRRTPAPSSKTGNITASSPFGGEKAPGSRTVIRGAAEAELLFDMNHAKLANPVDDFLFDMSAD